MSVATLSGHLRKYSQQMVEKLGLHLIAIEMLLQHVFGFFLGELVADDLAEKVRRRVNMRELGEHLMRESHVLVESLVEADSRETGRHSFLHLMRCRGLARSQDDSLLISMGQDELR